MFEDAINIINQSQKIIIIQPENPDGDSLGSSLALFEILSDLKKDVSLYCAVDMPKYLRYFDGWDIVTNEFDLNADIAIIIDTNAELLLEKTLTDPNNVNFLNHHQVIVIDHHDTKSSLKFNTIDLIEPFAATSEVIYKLAQTASWTINRRAAQNLLGSLLSDTLGLTTQSVNERVFQNASNFTKLGANVSAIEESRRKLMKKSPEILAYKGRLIERVEYYLEERLAIVNIPWEEIQKYSDQYNPGALIIDELRLVENIQVAVVTKTYPDGKITAKIRTNLPIAEDIANKFGGGGHKFASGFKVYEKYDILLKELIEIIDAKLMDT